MLLETTLHFIFIPRSPLPPPLPLFPSFLYPLENKSIRWLSFFTPQPRLLTNFLAFSRIPSPSHEFPHLLMKSLTSSRITLLSYEFPGLHTNSLAFSRIPLLSHEFPCLHTNSLPFSRIPLLSHEFLLLLMTEEEKGRGKNWENTFLFPNNKQPDLRLIYGSL